MDLSQTAKRIIQNNRYIVLATVSVNGEPWSTPLFFAHSDTHEIYWGSHKDAEHSKNIRNNDNVFINIFDSTIQPGSGEGVYIRARAEELTNEEEIHVAHKLLWNRHIVPYWKLEQFVLGSPLALYKATIQKVWVNSSGRADGHYIDTREEITL